MMGCHGQETSLMASGRWLPYVDKIPCDGPFGVCARRLTAARSPRTKMLRALKTLQPENDTRRIRLMSMNRADRETRKIVTRARVRPGGLRGENQARKPPLYGTSRKAAISCAPRCDRQARPRAGQPAGLRATGARALHSEFHPDNLSSGWWCAARCSARSEPGR